MQGLGVERLAVDDSHVRASENLKPIVQVTYILGKLQYTTQHCGTRARLDRKL
jgi:hypothetical protein